MDDQALRRRVEDELAWEPRVIAGGVGVTVRGGIVHLIGHVRSLEDKGIAERVVRRLKGVRGFVDDIEVRPPGLADDDETIAARVATLIAWDVTVPPGAIQVQVQDGFVSLTGDVEFSHQKHQPEPAIRRLAGVRGLSNQVTVTSKLTPQVVQERITDALSRQANLDASRIAIIVEGSNVRLGGIVRTAAERDVIERAAWSAPGVAAVVDETVVGD